MNVCVYKWILFAMKTSHKPSINSVMWEEWSLCLFCLQTEVLQFQHGYLNIGVQHTIFIFYYNVLRCQLNIFVWPWVNHISATELRLIEFSILIKFYFERKMWKSTKWKRYLHSYTYFQIQNQSNIQFSIHITTEDRKHIWIKYIK